MPSSEIGEEWGNPRMFNEPVVVCDRTSGAFPLAPIAGIRAP